MNYLLRKRVIITVTVAIATLALPLPARSGVIDLDTGQERFFELRLVGTSTRVLAEGSEEEVQTIHANLDASVPGIPTGSAQNSNQLRRFGDHLFRVQHLTLLSVVAADVKALGPTASGAARSVLRVHFRAGHGSRTEDTEDFPSDLRTLSGPVSSGTLRVEFLDSTHEVIQVNVNAQCIDRRTQRTFNVPGGVNEFAPSTVLTEF